ncbi:DUF2784 family protein, partial [Pseudomonas syringae pv. tagetis]|uniref:DUF2784 family protein n=1 Tax=Pseudomonas syringae group genomosp. 7 TaxID=251699 RepID=UPI00376FCAF4
MLYWVASVCVVMFYLLFLVLVMFGGVLVLRRAWLALVHVSAAVWGRAVEFLYLFCPLTALEYTVR